MAELSERLQEGRVWWDEHELTEEILAGQSHCHFLTGCLISLHSIEKHVVFNPFRGEFFWFYEVQRVDIFFLNGRKLISFVIGLYWTQHLN